LAGCKRRAAFARLRSGGRRRATLLDPPRDGVVDAYFAADLFVFGSQIECSPLVLFEATAAGLPFVTVPVGNSAEIAQWTGAGVVVDAPRRGGLVRGRAADMAPVVADLLRDGSRRRELGQRARAAWAADYSWSRVVDRYEALYRELRASSATISA
jgi:glycosyltransferase involved in cell wall biosynthesis